MGRPLGSVRAPLVVVLVVLGLSWSTVPLARASASRTPCWERVVNDWLADGAIDGAYTPACYQAALRHMPEDLRDYTDVAAAISVALQDALRHGGRGGTSSGAGPSDDLAAGGAIGTSPGPRSRTLQHAPGRSIYRRAMDSVGATNAESFPMPVLVLACVGAALVVAAAALAAHKRLTAPPAPDDSDA